MNLLHLLPPISSSAPCGPDPETKAELAMDWDGLFVERDSLYKSWSAFRQPPAAPPPSGAASPGPEASLRPPNWIPLQTKALELAVKTKNLHVAVILTECLMHTEGLGGLRDGLLLIAAWSATWWEHLHPGFSDKAELDLRPEIIEVLNHEKTIKRFEFAREQNAKGSNAQHAREARETSVTLMEYYDAQRQKLSLGKLVVFLDGVIGSSEDTSMAAPGEPASSEAKSASPATIDSRDAASQMLSRVIAYFRTAEPSSPVPFFLLRAQRCIGRDYIEIVKELGGDLTATDQVLKPPKAQQDEISQS